MLKFRKATLKSVISMLTVEDSMPFPHFRLLTDNKLHPELVLTSPMCFRHEDCPDMITTATNFKNIQYIQHFRFWRQDQKYVFLYTITRYFNRGQHKSMSQGYDQNICVRYLAGDYKDINVPVGTDIEQTHIIVEADVYEIQPNTCHLEVIKPLTSKNADVVSHSIEKLALDPNSIPNVYNVLY